MKTKGPIRFYLCWMLFMFCGVILYLGSCSDSDTVDSGTTDEYITISPFINNGVTTLIAGNNFEENDSIGLYVVSYEQDNTTPGSITSASAVNVQHIFRQSAWLLPSGGKLPWPSLERQVDLYSYYPFDAQLNSLNPLQYPFTVQGDQRTKDNYLLSDFLWSKTENVSPTSRPVSMIFSHKLSKVRVNVLLEVENLQNEVDQAIVSVVNVNPTGNINLSDGSVALAGNAPENIITYKYSTPAAGYNLSAEGIIIPQQATQGQPFIRIEFPLTGVRYHFIPEQNIPFEQGMERTINITISELGISVTVGEIIEWRPSEIIEGEIGKPIPRVLDLGSIDWNASRIHHLYYDGVWIGDACREYLFGGGIDAQAIVIYSVDAQSSLDTSTGFVGQVMNRNRNPATNEYFPNTSAVHGGQVNWGTNNQISSYVAGTSAVTNKIEFRDDGSFVGVPDVYITNIETAPYLMTDIDGNSYPIVK